MNKIRRIDFYPDEWLAGTKRLSAVERGVYITICALIYSEGGALDYSDDDIAHECRMPVSEVQLVLSSLEQSGKVKRRNGKISNARCDAELKKASERIAKAKEAGRAGGRRTQSRNLLNDIVNQTSECLSDAKADGQALLQGSLKLTNNQQPTTNIPPKSPKGEPDRFAEFWDIWKQAKPSTKNPRKAALDAFVRALRQADADDIIRGARLARDQYKRKNEWGGNYVPSGSVWLNQQRWQDILSTDKPKVVDDQYAELWAEQRRLVQEAYAEKQKKREAQHGNP